ncbi:MAG TPA: acyltransferase [Acidimicrobiales bacterium]|nr:acyltransferase [Acidimicrobiales bacterium]
MHATAEVAHDAVLGDGTHVWNEAQVLAGASIGPGCVVGKGAYVDRGVSVGARVKIQNYALLYRGAVVEDEVLLGPACVLTNDMYPRAANPDGTPKSDADWTPAGVVVRKGASVGAGAVVLAGVEVGRYAMVAAGAVVSRAVPDHGLAMGVPARLVGEVCACGRPLGGDPPLCRSCPSSPGTDR